MARLNVNPTRMELSRLKKRLATATRGHKLLKDKLDELMKQFLDLVRENMRTRARLEANMADSYMGMDAAAALLPPQALEQSFMYPMGNIDIDISYKNIMSVNVPVYSVRHESGVDIYPYSFATTPARMDESLRALRELLDDMLRLAELEKTVKLLASEIEKTRRRVNALEYVMIPQLNETIKYISMKLDENERGNQTRLMKVKDLVLNDARAQKQKNAGI